MGLTSQGRLSALSTPPSRWAWWVGTIAGAFLGAVLLFAVYGKAIDPAGFEEQIHGEGLDFLFPASMVVFIALGLEAGVGAALLMGVRTLWVLLPAAAMTGLFLFLTGRTYLNFLDGSLDASSSCGCFGQIIERSPEEAFWQDLALLLPSMLLAWVGRPRALDALPFVRGVGAAVFTVLVLIFAGLAPELPLDDLATRLKPGAVLSELCVGQDAPADAQAAASDEPLVLGGGEGRACLSERILHPRVIEWNDGEYLVILVDVESPRFLDSLDELNEFANDPDSLPLVVLSPSPEEVVGDFASRHGTAFEPFPVERALLRPLFRRLPRSFTVSKGVVQETFSDLPPLGKMKGVGGAREPVAPQEPGDRDEPSEPSSDE